MTETAPDPAEDRTFLAHPRDHRHRTMRVQAPSAIAAALAYAEQAGETDEEGRLAVTVEDCGSGERHCFVVDLDDGEVGAC